MKKLILFLPFLVIGCVATNEKNIKKINSYEFFRPLIDNYFEIKNLNCDLDEIIAFYKGKKGFDNKFDKDFFERYLKVTYEYSKNASLDEFLDPFFQELIVNIISHVQNDVTFEDKSNTEFLESLLKSIHSSDDFPNFIMEKMRIVLWDKNTLEVERFNDFLINYISIIFSNKMATFSDVDERGYRKQVDVRIRDGKKETLVDLVEKMEKEHGVLVDIKSNSEAILYIPVDKKKKLFY